MALNFFPVWTQDGSIGLFNEEVDDIYHSSYGAYSESLQKFIMPCGILENSQEKSNIRILDICYGMGYNSKTSIEKLSRINYTGEVFIDALEMDINVVAFSFLCKSHIPNFDFWDFADFKLFDDKNMLDSVFSIIENIKFDDFLDEQKVVFLQKYKNHLYKYIGSGKITAELHNIYYRYISARNIKNDARVKKRPKTALAIHLGDAREQIFNLEGKYDYIYLDAFTPAKLPTLWTVEFFKILNNLLNENGCLVTYSNSAAIRMGLLESGFFLGKTEQGTIAYKKSGLVKNPLDAKSLGLMQTKAGIPFYDPDLCSTKDEILSLRKSMIENSTLQNSSQFLKNFQKNKYRL